MKRVVVTLQAPRGLSRLGPLLQRVVRAVLAAEGRPVGEIGIVLTDDAELRALNRRWRRIDRATDVLSFVYSDVVPEAGRSVAGRGGAARGGEVSGDLVISLERVVAQARRYRVTRGRELARLLVHGALHLVGLDHQRAAERRNMRRKEDRALRAAAAEVKALDRALASARWA